MNMRSPAVESEPFELFLFYRDDQSALAAIDAGVDGLIVDLEHTNKEARQAGFDTEINRHDLDTLKQLRSLTNHRLFCRVDHSQPLAQADIDRVIEAGANEIILPMITSLEQASAVTDWCRGKAGLTIMIETPEAVAQAHELAQLDATRFYVGLNDLHILRRTPHIFSALGDGTLDAVREKIGSRAFGYGGLTIPGLGSPLPVSHLYNDMARLDCSFTFLRRSFYQDTTPEGYAAAIASIRAEFAKTRARNDDTVVSDNQAMIDMLVRQKVLLSA